MNRRLLIFALSLVALLAGSAAAQEDSLLQRYDLAIENLEIATASVPDDGVQARDELERALNALLTLSTNATSPSLVLAMERTFDRTRATIENQSRTDMAVQTAVLAGGFARLVMDSAFTAAAAGELDLARSRLLHLAQDLAFDPADEQAVRDAASGSELRLAFEAGAAGAIGRDVSSARTLLEMDQPAAYRSLANAYGRSLLVQDSPRLDAQLNRQLVAAANALVAHDTGAAQAALEVAQAELASLGAAARGTEPSTVVQPAPLLAAPEELPEVGAAAPQQAATTEQPDEPTAGEEQGASAESSQRAPATGSQTPAPLSGPDFEAAVQARMAALEAEQREATLAQLAAQLTRAGVPAANAAAEADQLLASGYATLEAAVTELEAEATGVVAAQRAGDGAGVQAAVARLRATYQGALAPLLRAGHPETATATERLLASLEQRPSITSHDVSLLAAQTAAIGNALAGRPAQAGQQLELAVDAYWSGLTRTIVQILLALLAIVPLFLLNLAFGGSNQNWRLVGWALFLLLVPVFYEGLAALADLLSTWLAVPWLASLSSWSFFSSTTGQVVWTAVVLIALLLATIGLYGLCVQFGLLGGSRRQRPPASSTPTAERTAPTGNTTIDWDEEF